MLQVLSPLTRQTYSRARTLARRPGVLLALIAVTVAGCLLTRLPLFELPGYELSMALSLSLALLCGVLGIFAARQERALLSGVPTVEGWQPRPSGAGAIGLTAAASASLGALVLLPPFLAAVLGALTTSHCSPWTGIGFYLLLPLPTVLLASFTGALAGFATRRAWTAVLLYLGLVLTTLAVSLTAVWAGPQIFALNHFLGYFPGPLYDEALEVESRLVAYRALTLVWTLVVFTAGSAFVDPARAVLARRAPKGRHAFAGATLLTAVALFWLYDFDLGLQTRHGDLARELGGQSETAHFVLHYPRTKPLEDVRRLERDLEFKYGQVTGFFGVDAAEFAGEGRKIHAWFHKSPQEKRRLVGAAHTNFAKPWRSEFHVHDDPFPHDVIRHEMAHVIARRFGSPLLGVSARALFWVNAGLVEGLAVAADNRADELTVHQWAAAMRRLQLAPDVRQIVSPTGFYAVAQGRAYTLIGSFLRFLSERYGSTALRALYPAGDFHGAFGKGIDALAKEWEAYLDALPLDDGAMNVAKVRFERQSLFARPCAREVASLREEADRLRWADPDRALANYRRCAEIDPHNVSHLRSQADLLRHRKDRGGARRIWEQILSTFGEDKGTRALALMALGDLAWEDGDLDGASARFREVLGLRRDRGTSRTATVKLEALARGTGHESLRRYFTSSPDLPEVLELKELTFRSPDYATPKYLIGRQLFQRKDYAGAKQYLSKAFEAGIADLEVRRECLRVLAQAAYFGGDFAGARRALDQLLEQEASEADRAFAEDWRARCDFEERLFGGPLLQ